MKPPVMSKKNYSYTVHGRTIEDPYHWFRQKENEEVLEHLKQENEYTESFFEPLSSLTEQLYQELKGRVKEDDEQVPVKKDDYYYYKRFEKGQEYPIHCRKFKSMDAPEEVILDVNEVASGQDFCKVPIVKVSPDHSKIAYLLDHDGSEQYKVRFRDLKTGGNLPDELHGCFYSLEWANDSQTVFYNKLNDNQRPVYIFRHQIGTSVDADVMVYEEKDSEYFVSLSKSRSQKYLCIETGSQVTDETWLINADTPTQALRLFAARKKNTKYSVYHWKDRFFILTNTEALNFKVCEVKDEDSCGREHWKEFLPHELDHYLQHLDVFQNYLVIWERIKGLPQLRIIDLNTRSSHFIEFPDPAYGLFADANPNFGSESFRFIYTSLCQPNSTFEYNMKMRNLKTLKVEEIPSGFDPKNYRTERIQVKSHDGTEVPVSILYRSDLKKDKKNPCYLYGYGSYGIGMPASFRRNILSLVDRGFVFALAHIRGGDEMGRQWYEDGKYLQKKNTFLDFIAAAEGLIERNFTSKGEIVICGGSAGGMLVGATLNMRPELFKAGIAHVPFVDVINTMLDNSLPLTEIEYEEWGNPNNQVYFDYMMTYSPYDNIKEQQYPPIYVTAGLNDPRVTYWEPAKWVAKLREYKKDSNPALLHTNMGAGHGGKSGRFKALSEDAREYAFILKVFGMAN